MENLIVVLENTVYKLAVIGFAMWLMIEAMPKEVKDGKK